MKAEELMIGDWVNVGNDEFAFPDQIYSLGYDEVDSGHGDMVGTYRYDELFPIPLTPEILEKNGFVEEEYPIIYDRREFELRHGDYRIIVSPLNDGYTRIYKGGYLPILNNCYINFVHELQHALRLCGIDKTIEL